MKSFKFENPRQEKIHSGLLKIGPGPAAFYKDSCILMAEDDPLECTSHLVAHLLRDIESAITAVLESPEDREIRNINKEGHKQKILNILKALEIDETGDIAKAWLKIPGKDNDYGLASRAHRDNLSYPRPIDDEYFLFFDNMEKILLVVIEKFQIHFINHFELLDSLLSKSQPGDKEITILQKNIPFNEVSLRYFFDKLEHPQWLNPLNQHGWFNNPTQIIEDSDGSIRYPDWPQARYLRRMASIQPDDVLGIIMSIPDSRNIRIYGDLIDAILEMPYEHSVKMVPTIIEWIKTSHDLRFLPERITNLIIHLANEDTIEQSIQLFNVLYGVITTEEQTASSDETTINSDNHTRIRGWEYGKGIDSCLTILSEVGKLKFLEVLCDILEEMIKLYLNKEETMHSDHSYIWRKSISEQEEHYNSEIKNILVTSIYKTTKTLIEMGITSDALEAIEKKSFKVFHRIGLQIRTEYPLIDPSGTAGIITDSKVIHEINMHHELFNMIKEHYADFPPDVKNRYIELIDEGIEKEDPPSEYHDIHNRRWQYRKLLPCDGNLDEKWQQLLDELKVEFTDEKHPDFHIYQEGAVVGPWSPLSDEEIAQMDITSLVAFFNNWKSEGGFKAPSREGLGRSLAKDASTNPEKYASKALLLKNQDPTYVRSILSGLRDTIQKDNSFTWSPVLDLCEWVMAQTREIPGREIEFMEGDPDWGWTRRTIADLLSIGFKSGTTEISIEYRTKVWDILLPITNDPDPTPEHEAKYGGTNMDPSNLSINTTRGEAMHATMRYALWVQSYVNTDTTEQDIAHSFDEIPEVRDVLEDHLSNDPSLAIRSVYGQWFPQLAGRIDSEWTKDNMKVIFPHDKLLRKYWHAAWDTYLKFHKPYDVLFELLEDEYLFAIDQLPISIDDQGFYKPEEKLAEHIMSLYCRDKLDFASGILCKFYEKAPETICARAIWFLGRILKDNDELPKDYIERIMELFEIRLKQAKDSDDPGEFTDELGGFGFWLSSDKLDDVWKIDQILEVVQIIHIKDIHTHTIVTEISKLAQSYPLKTNLCLKTIVEGDEEGWSVYGWRDEAKAILRAGLESGEVNKISKETISLLLTKGHTEFRDLI